MLQTIQTITTYRYCHIGGFSDCTEWLRCNDETSSGTCAASCLQRAAAQKAFRSTNKLREDNDQDRPVALEELCEQFNDRYPALTEYMDYLLSISYRPRGDIMNFASRINTFAYWLNAEFLTRQR